MPYYVRYALGVGFLTIFGTLLTIAITTPQDVGSFGTLVLMGAAALSFVWACLMFVIGWLTRPARARVAPVIPVFVVYTLQIDYFRVGNCVIRVVTESVSYYTPRPLTPPQ